MALGRDELFALARATKGFMPDDEGLALFDAGLETAEGSTWLEIGSWCGKSALYLGGAALERHALLYSLDHHHGSEEQQPGWEYFDESLVDPSDGRLNTLPHFQRSIADAQLEDTVVAIVGSSQRVAPHFAQPLDLLFIDGGHGADVAWSDFELWTPKLRPGALLLLHDVFPDPADGGRPPYEIYLEALQRGFTERRATGSLRVLRAPLH